MKRLFFFLFILFTTGIISAQSFAPTIEFWNTLFIDGFTKVKDAGLREMSYNLDDELGITRIQGLGISFEYRLNENNRLAGELNFYDINAEPASIFRKLYEDNNFYAQLAMNVEEKTSYTNITLLNYIKLYASPENEVNLIYGVTLDILKFAYETESPIVLIEERYDEHVVPVPNIGALWKKKVSKGAKFTFELIGGIWPGIKTWHSDINDVWQYNLEANIAIEKQFGDIITGLAANYRRIYFKAENKSQSNELLLGGFGPRFYASYSL